MESQVDWDAIKKDTNFKASASMELEPIRHLLNQLIEHRKMAAKRLFKVAYKSEAGIELQNIIAYDNEKIKQVLAL